MSIADVVALYQSPSIESHMSRYSLRSLRVTTHNIKISKVVSLTFCCFVVYSTRRYVLSLALCYYVIEFFSPLSIAITSLGEERANLCAFRTFVRFALVWFYLFLLPLGVWERLRLVIVALPGLFSYSFGYLSMFVSSLQVCWVCRFPLPLGVWEVLRFVIVALPGLFSYLFL